MNGISMKDLARAAEVSVPTVSRALKGDPQISSATTERIRNLAAEMGYRKDPALDVLARLRWGENKGRFRNTLGFLTHADLNREGYLKGARACGEKLGYVVDEFRIEDYIKSRALERVLESRGIRGLILPTFTDKFKAPDLTWNNYAVVACSVDSVHPPFHVVRTNVIRKIEIAWEQCLALGCKRIGFVLTHDDYNELDVRRQAAALQLIGTLSSKDRVPLCMGNFLQLAKVHAWFDRYQPEAVIVGHGSVVGLIRGLEKDKDQIPVCCLSACRDAAYLSSKPDRIGYTAVSLLHQQILENNLGPPPDPFTVVIEPEWVDNGNWGRGKSEEL